MAGAGRYPDGMACRALLVLGILAAAATGLAAPPTMEDRLPAVLPQESSVKDPVLALIVGLVATDSYGTLTHARLDAWLQRHERRTRLPYHRVAAISRSRAAGSEPGTVSFEFTGEVDEPLPYSVLGYHPGDMLASRTCTFREWPLGTMSVERGPDDEVILEDVHLYALEQGDIGVDVDAWIDVLLGNALDDTKVAFLMLCRIEGRWHGFAMGDSDDDEPRSGILDLARDKALIPVPRRLRGIAWAMRKYGESMPALVAGRAARCEEMSAAP